KILLKATRRPKSFSITKLYDCLVCYSQKCNFFNPIVASPNDNKPKQMTRKRGPDRSLQNRRITTSTLSYCSSSKQKIAYHLSLYSWVNSSQKWLERTRNTSD